MPPIIRRRKNNPAHAEAQSGSLTANRSLGNRQESLLDLRGDQRSELGYGRGARVDVLNGSGGVVLATLAKRLGILGLTLGANHQRVMSRDPVRTVQHGVGASPQPLTTASSSFRRFSCSMSLD